MVADAPASPDISPEAFAAILTSAGAPGVLALAVSGGRDSMALARLCAAYSASTGAAIHAFTVDHGLREGAAAEAARAKAWCAALGIPHQTLRWTGTKPATGLQAAARAARYKLLIAAAHECGAGALLTAHTFDDQAETMFMRLARGAGARGLAAMRADTLIAAGAGVPLRLLRPLLGFSRTEITSYLASVGQDFVEDPSNLDDRFERVRVRALLAALAEQSLLTADALAASAQKLAAADMVARRYESELFVKLGGCLYGWGGVSLDRWSDDFGAGGLAARLIHAVGGGDYAPDPELALDAVARAESGAATLAGTLVKRWRDRLWFLREPSALLGRAGVAPLPPAPLDGPLLWDRRFILDPGGETGLAVAPLGADAAALIGPAAARFQGPPEALSTLPGLWRQGVLIAAPALPFIGRMELSGRPSCRALTIERFDGEILRFASN